jgi:hypothetical protein
MLVRVAVTAQVPDEQGRPAHDQQGADDVTLLGLDLALKLETDECDHAAEDEGRKDVGACRKRAHATEPEQGPPLRASHHRQRHPVVGEQRVHETDGGCSHEQQGHWVGNGACHQ